MSQKFKSHQIEFKISNFKFRSKFYENAIKFLKMRFQIQAKILPNSNQNSTANSDHNSFKFKSKFDYKYSVLTVIPHYNASNTNKVSSSNLNLEGINAIIHYCQYLLFYHSPWKMYQRPPNTITELARIFKLEKRFWIFTYSLTLMKLIRVMIPRTRVITGVQNRTRSKGGPHLSESCEVRTRVPLRFYAERQENVQIHKQKILSTAGRRTLEPSPHFPSFLFISRMRMSPVIFMNTCSWNVSWIFNNQENRHSSSILGKLS